MGIQKAFVIKNSLEVSTDLILADAARNKVGIGSTTPRTELDVRGGIAATDISVSGVGTIVTLQSTTGTVTNLGGTNLNYSGIGTIGNVLASNANVSGITTTTSLNVSGIATVAVGIVTNLTVTGFSTLNAVSAGNITLAGITTGLNVSGVGTIVNLRSTNANVTGVGTIGSVVVRSGIVTATSGIVTYYGDGRYLQNVISGVGIATSGGVVGYGVTFINFYGAGVSTAYYSSTTGIATVYFQGGGTTGGVTVSIGTVAPSSPTSGGLWYNNEIGRTFIYYDEVYLGIGSAQVWVDAAPFNIGVLNPVSIALSTGTFSSPSLYFSGDSDTGLFQPSSNQQTFVAAGASVLNVNPGGINVTGVGSFSAGSASAPSVSIRTSTNGLYSPGADQLALSTAGTGRLFVDASGNVSAATGRLIISSSSAAGVSDVSLGSYVGGAWINTPSATDGYLAVAGTAAYKWSSSLHAWFTGGTEKVRITSDGKFGIGTINPSTTLQLVDGTPTIRLQESSVSEKRLELSVNATAEALISAPQSGSSLLFSTTGLERARITSDGKFGLGSTSDPGSYGSKLWVDHTADTGITINTTGSTSRTQLVFRNANVNGEARIYNGTGGPLTIYKNSSEEAVRLDSSGRLLVGTSTNTGAYYDFASDWQGRFQVARSDQNAVASFSIWNSTASTYTNYGGVQLHLSACKSGTVGSHTSGALSSGDTIGSITFDASDGANFRNSARIEAIVDGGVSTGDVPGRLVFSTTADGAATPTERMRITSDGKVGIGTINPSTTLQVQGDVSVVGVVTATSFVGNGSQLTGITAGVTTSKTVALNLLFGY